MNIRYKNAVIDLNLWRIAIAKLMWSVSKCKGIIEEDFMRWKSILSNEFQSESKLMFLGYLLMFKKEYRNLFYHRLKGKEKIFAVCFRLLFNQMDTLFIQCPKIGGGLFIQHGFSTIIAAREIGKNCWINQQVTIGFKGLENPIIGDNVTICCGAKVIGGIKVENDCIIGANAVVISDVEQNSVMVGVPARKIKDRYNVDYEKV